MVNHPQLHEVVFACLPTTAVLALRRVSGATHRTVVLHAEAAVLNTIQQARSFSSTIPWPYVMLLHAALPAGDFSRMCHAAVTLCEEMFAGTSQRQGWARQCRALQLLVSVRVVRAIALHCPALKRFFARFQLLSDDVLQPLILRCPQLEELAMPWNLLLTDASIQLAGMHCPNLELLHVAGNSEVTDASIQLVALHCPKLRVLTASTSLPAPSILVDWFRRLARF